MIVGGNDDLVWPDLSRGSFDLTRIWIVVCPNFEVVTQACMFFLDIFNDYNRLTVVSIPPFVWHLDVGIWICFSDCSGLSKASWSPMPLMVKCAYCLVSGSMEFVEGYGLFIFSVSFNGYSSIGHHGFKVGDAFLVKGLPVFSCFLMGLRHRSEVEWSFHSSVFFGAILPGVVGEFCDLNVSCGEKLLDGIKVPLGLKLYESLYVGRSAFSFLKLGYG